MDLNSFEGKPSQNPDLHRIWAEYFPKYVRMGLVGLVGTFVVSAVFRAHNKFSNNPTEIEPPQDQTSPNGPAI